SLVIVVILLFTQRMTLRRHFQVELQNAVDAAALAAVADMARDDVLCGDPDIREEMMAGCRRSAKHFAALNRVQGERLHLKDNPKNFVDGEVVLGQLDGPESRDFDAELKGPFDPHMPDLNAISIALQRGRTAARAGAYADHDVIGFEVLPGVRREQHPKR